MSNEVGAGQIATVASLAELTQALIEMGMGDHFVFLSSDPEGNSFNAMTNDIPGPPPMPSVSTHLYKGCGAIALWAGYPQHVDLADSP